MSSHRRGSVQAIAAGTGLGLASILAGAALAHIGVPAAVGGWVAIVSGSVFAAGVAAVCVRYGREA